MIGSVEEPPGRIRRRPGPAAPESDGDEQAERLEGHLQQVGQRRLGDRAQACEVDDVPSATPGAVGGEARPSM